MMQGLNVLLRLAWMQSVLGIRGAPFVHRTALIAIVACLEIIRRGIWNFFRYDLLLSTQLSKIEQLELLSTNKHSMFYRAGWRMSTWTTSESIARSSLYPYPSTTTVITPRADEHVFHEQNMIEVKVAEFYFLFSLFFVLFAKYEWKIGNCNCSLHFCLEDWTKGKVNTPYLACYQVLKVFLYFFSDILNYREGIQVHNENTTILANAAMPTYWVKGWKIGTQLDASLNYCT